MRACTIVFVIMLLFVFTGCEKKEPTKYSAKEGETFRYNFWMTQQVEPTGERAKGQRILFRAGLLAKTLKVNQSGFTLKIIIQNPSASLSGEGERKALKTAKALEGARFLMAMNEKGEIGEITYSGDDSAPTKALALSLMRSFREVFPSLPERLTHGAAWSRESEHTDENGLSMETTTAFEAAGHETIDGFSTTKIRVRFDIDLKGAPTREKKKQEPQENLGEKPQAGQEDVQKPKLEAKASEGVSGQGDGHGHLYFSEKLGRLVAANYDTVIHLESKGGKQTIRSHIQIRPAKTK